MYTIRTIAGRAFFFFFLIIILASLLSNIDYTIAYVFPIANIECRTRARAGLLIVSHIALYQVSYSSGSIVGRYLA